MGNETNSNGSNSMRAIIWLESLDGSVLNVAAVLVRMTLTAAGA